MQGAEVMSFCVICGKLFLTRSDADNRRCRYCEARKQYLESVRTPEGMIDVLQFIHDRMIHVHGENRDADYMHALRECIEALKPKVTARQVDTSTGCVTANYGWGEGKR